MLDANSGLVWWEVSCDFFNFGLWSGKQKLHNNFTSWALSRMHFFNSCNWHLHLSTCLLRMHVSIIFFFILIFIDFQNDELFIVLWSLLIYADIYYSLLLFEIKIRGKFSRLCSKFYGRFIVDVTSLIFFYRKSAYVSLLILTQSAPTQTCNRRPLSTIHKHSLICYSNYTNKISRKGF